jgi:hypothetical protein
MGAPGSGAEAGSRGHGRGAARESGTRRRLELAQARRARDAAAATEASPRPATSEIRRNCNSRVWRCGHWWLEAMARQLLPAAMTLPPTLLASTNSGMRASQIWSTSVGCWVSLSIVSFPLVVAPCADECPCYGRDLLYPPCSSATMDMDWARRQRPLRPW